LATDERDFGGDECQFLKQDGFVLPMHKIGQQKTSRCSPPSFPPGGGSSAVRCIPAYAHQNDIDWKAHSFGSQHRVSSLFSQNDQPSRVACLAVNAKKPFTVRTLSSHASSTMWLNERFLPAEFGVAQAGQLLRVDCRPQLI